VATRNTPQRDAVATKARILDAATSEFAHKGFDGARVQSIAAKAKVNINLVYHYFQDKENLFVVVMEAAYSIVRSHHGDLELRNLPPDEAMRRLIIATFRMAIEFPEIIGLLTAENMQLGRHVRGSSLISSLYDTLLDFIKDTLDRGSAGGMFRGDVDPTQLFISINAEGYFYLSNRYTLGAILRRDLDSKENLAERENFICDVIMGYLRPI